MTEYISLQVVKDRIGKGVADTTDHDAKLGQLITAASVAIDRLCRRPAGGFVGRALTRVYDVAPPTLGGAPWENDYTRGLTGQYGDGLAQIGIDRWGAITTVATDADGDGVYETIWLPTDYDLLPLNAAQDGDPYTTLRVRPTGQRQLTVGGRRLQITGIFGETANLTTPPAPITEACFLLVNRLFSRRQSPFGLAGTAREFGGAIHINQTDGDVEMLLRDAGYVEELFFA